MTQEQRAVPCIELVYDRDCPNADRARAAIRQALVAIRAPVVWREWDSAGDETPVALRMLGSPTILVNGQDVARVGSSVTLPVANSCRIYHDDRGRASGAPSVDLILRALSSAGTPPGGT